MIDRGLAISLALTVAAAWSGARLAPPRTFDRPRLFDVLGGPVVSGLIVGRVVAMALTDFRGLTEVRDVLILRGGVELWPALGVGAAVLVRGARRDGVAVLPRLVDVLPYVLWAMAAYDAACVVREGCFGPVSPVGLVPPGLHTRLLPLGLVTAAATALAGWAVGRRWPRDLLSTAVLTVAFIAAQRAVVSIWLPRFGTGLTRQHIESISVAAFAAICLIAVTLSSRPSWSPVPPGPPELEGDERS